MQRDATLTYSESLLRSAVFAFWRRTLGLGFFVAMLAIAASLLVMRAQGVTGWLLGALAAVLCMAVLLVAALYFVHYRRAMHTFRSMGDSQAMFRADDSSFTLSSSLGTTTLRWSAVSELWQFSDVWLLLYSKAQFSTLPVACVPPELLAFVRDRVQAAGGKVDG